MKPNLENLKEYTQKTSLTQEEKNLLFQKIEAYTETNPLKVSGYSIFFRHSIVYTSILALIVGTSATSFAAEKALPGDILYPVKTEINEKIAKTLALTNTQKAKVNVKLVDKRMEELTKIVAADQDTPEKVNIIVAQLEEHKEEIKEYVEDIQTEDTEGTQDALAIATELESVVDAHIDVLEEISDESPKDEVASTASSNPETDVVDISSTMIAIQEVQTSEIISTTTEDTFIPQNAVSEILDFSAELEPILIEAKTKNKDNEYEAASTKIKENTRKRIIEKAEEELHINVEEEPLHTKPDINIPKDN